MDLANLGGVGVRIGRLNQSSGEEQAPRVNGGVAAVAPSAATSTVGGALQHCAAREVPIWTPMSKLVSKPRSSNDSQTKEEQNVLQCYLSGKSLLRLNVGTRYHMRAFLEFGHSSLQGYERAQNTCFIVFWEGWMIRDRSLLTSWTLDFQVFCRFLIYENEMVLNDLNSSGASHNLKAWGCWHFAAHVTRAKQSFVRCWNGHNLLT